MQAPDPTDFVKSAVEVGDAGLMAGAVVGLFGLADHGPEHAGSGVLVCIGDRLFVGTAGHLGFGPQFRGPFLYRAGTDMVRKDASRDVDVLDCQFTDDENGYDLGYIEVRPNHSLGNVWAIPAHRISDSAGSETGVYMVQGYPSQLLDLTLRTKDEVKSDIFMATLQLAWLRPDRYGHVFDYIEEGRVDAETAAALPHPRGLSGGPIWEVDDLRAWQHNLDLVDTRTLPRGGVQTAGEGVRLFAIQSSWYSSTRESYAVRASEWLDFLKQRRPDVAGSL